MGRYSYKYASSLSYRRLLCIFVSEHFRKINLRKCHQNKDISKYRTKTIENMQEVKRKNKVRLKEWVSIFLKDVGRQVTQKTQELEAMYD